MPEQDGVVAITSGVKDMQAVLNIIWDKLLPAISLAPLGERAGMKGTSSSAAQQLKDKLAHLQIRTPEGPATSPLASKILNRKFTFPANDQRIETVALSLSDSGKTLTLTTRMNGKEVTSPCGYHEW